MAKERTSTTAHAGVRLHQPLTLQFPHRHTKLALPLDPDSSCSSCWLKETTLGCSSRQDVHEICYETEDDEHAR